MPELPEVETMRRGVLGAAGGTIVTAQRLACTRKPITVRPSMAIVRRRCKGQQIVDVGRRGKRVVLELANGCRLIFEPRMTGLLLISDAPSKEHLRFRLEISGAAINEILYWDRRGLGGISCWTAAEYEAQLGPDRLGPDALELSVEELTARLSTSRRAIKVALLDQKKLAGVGNLYASEILHLARIDPRRACQTLTAAQWRKLHRAQRQVLKQAIQHEGSTLGDGTYRNALSDPGGYQNHHRVYARTDERCLSCRRGRIQRIVQAQRSTFFCPKCQK